MKCVNVNKKILIVAIVILCIFAVFSFTMVSNAEEVTVIGTWDISKDDGTSKVTATLYSDGRFVISGTGEMKDYSGSNNSPYYNYKESIKTVEIQNEVTSIGNYAFENCKSLTSIEISSNVTIIGDDAFAYCTNLTSIEIPSSVTSIGSSAFLDCTNLTSIEIPSSVTSVGYYAFSECTSLNSINVDKSNQKYSSEDGILFDKDKKELIRYPTGKKEKEYNIPSSVTRIEWAAFSGCTSLTSIEIPSSVTSIGFAAFGSCTNLTRIEIPSSVTRIGSSAFHSCTSLTRIEIQSSVTSIKIEGGAFAYCTSLTNIEIPSGVTSIGNAFYGCTSLNSINVDKDNQLYSSEDGILFDKVKTKLITYPAGKKEKEYNIPSGVTSIGGWAFYGCTSLTRIEIPSSITSIGGWAFSGCTSLTSIEIPSSVTSIGGYAFDRAKLTMVVVAESKNVQEIELPDIIKRAMNKGDILYTSSDFELTNCSLTEDKTKLEVASKETVRLKVKEGALSGISVVVKVVSLKKYEVTEENGEVYIEDINPGTKIQEFIDNIETNGTMKFCKGNSEITDVNSKVQTGMIMKITLGEQETSCKLIVRGDLNGDGEMGDIDLLKLVRYQAGLDTSLNGAYLKAADVYKDGTYADNKDLLKMARVLAGLDSL
ncbi:MAG TPA: hypothetical protein DER15_07640 [Clostridiales bacterium]|jgi:hypothetical protein|nr:hypothetical protein [Clostridiales bacterium]